MSLLSSLRDAIGGPYEAATAEARRHLDSLTKPPASLGRPPSIRIRHSPLRRML